MLSGLGGGDDEEEADCNLKRVDDFVVGGAFAVDEDNRGDYQPAQHAHDAADSKDYVRIHAAKLRKTILYAIFR